MKFILLTFSVLPLFHSVSEKSRPPHAVYLSMIEIVHEKVSSKAVVSIKVFINDLEDAIRNEFEESVKLDDVTSCDLLAKPVVSYFQNHLSLSINGEVIKLPFTYCEINGDAIWFRFKLNVPKNWAEVRVRADFLMELFPTQSNVISITNGEAKYFMRLTQSNPSGMVKF